jgi:hypothetical protein
MARRHAPRAPRAPCVDARWLKMVGGMPFGGMSLRVQRRVFALRFGVTRISWAAYGNRTSPQNRSLDWLIPPDTPKLGSAHMHFLKFLANLR